MQKPWFQLLNPYRYLMAGYSKERNFLVPWTIPCPLLKDTQTSVKAATCRGVSGHHRTWQWSSSGFTTQAMDLLSQSRKLPTSSVSLILSNQIAYIWGGKQNKSDGLHWILSDFICTNTVPVTIVELPAWGFDSGSACVSGKKIREQYKRTS